MPGEASEASVNVLSLWNGYLRQDNVCLKSLVVICNGSQRPPGWSIRVLYTAFKAAAGGALPLRYALQMCRCTQV
jgi:hypothetical protein